MIKFLKRAFDICKCEKLAVVESTSKTVIWITVRLILFDKASGKGNFICLHESQFQLDNIIINKIDEKNMKCDGF